MKNYDRIDKNNTNRGFGKGKKRSESEKKAVVMLKRRYKRQNEGRFGLLSAARLDGA